MTTEQDIKILEGKISNARNRIAQAEKQYVRSLAKLERQTARSNRTAQSVLFGKSDRDVVKFKTKQDDERI